ncbi:uncharacterized protein LOC130512661 [Raphanus sativus]|uniref:Uncharacterized protein LOC130512661 n=1 Tax=Raphanus sativus TaxID=3726 RepID=A0A9W3DT91_RAPSA|nr:uncharacterized protein LOC130512661 [Raphanus sativus]
MSSSSSMKWKNWKKDWTKFSKISVKIQSTTLSRPKPKSKRNEHILNETVKQDTPDYGMTTSPKIPHMRNISSDAVSNVPFFQHRPDATGRLGLSPLQKCTAAIRMLSYGFAADAVDEYLRLGESTTLSCLHHFTDGIVQLFGEQYLRRPTAEDLQRLLDIGEKRGFPGMIGSIDCMHWEWKNCPTTWKGQYLKDINVLDRSPVFDDIIEGRAPRLEYVVNGHKYKLAYYLTDGIYPKWSTFIQSISRPQGLKAQLFAKKQEAARKDVERAFGVLQARFAIVKNPPLTWDKKNREDYASMYHNTQYDSRK